MAGDGGNGNGIGVDSISSLPDDILHIILSSIPTKFAIRTSVWSKRWRHVWSDTPSLSFESCEDTTSAYSVDETLARYTAHKMMSFHLYTSVILDDVPYINRWIELAMSRNVERMSLEIHVDNYGFPDLFYINSSVKQLTLNYSDLSDMMIPRCFVSWTSLKKLSLRCCTISDEFFAKILSGCPILEGLKLNFCHTLMVIDLSKLLRLRTLEIYESNLVRGSTQIVAPHIHCLNLITYAQSPSTLVDVSSLTAASLEIWYRPHQTQLKTHKQVMVLKILGKLQNVERLTLGTNLLKILSLAELRGVLFPRFKNIKDLTLETVVSQYVTPGLVRVLHNSPGLKTLTLHIMDSSTLQIINPSRIEDKYLDKYLDLHGLDSNQWWIFLDIFRQNPESKHVASLVELVLKTTKALEKMAVRWEGCPDGRRFEELLEMLSIISHDNNVSVALIDHLKRKQRKMSTKWDYRKATTLYD
ncbi:unnamed protein product [Thlaspi arvense]|uniref:F-box domain-containing protein n=1 Tax=Thlaspi arvense TaxID=13288 RepID=A0AAU9SA90_THLAR|nr:unnamed protein product [Thlaspi arvense]